MPISQCVLTPQKYHVGLVSCAITTGNWNVLFCCPLANPPASLVLLQIASADDWVTVCGPAPCQHSSTGGEEFSPAPQIHVSVCPAGTVIAKGTIRKSPFLGATCSLVRAAS